MADSPPTSRIARTRRFGGLVAGQGLRWAGTRAANALRTDEAADVATGERAAATAREEVKATLASLRDDVPPLPFKAIEKLMKEELEMPVSQAFAEFEPEAFAAAS